MEVLYLLIPLVLVAIGVAMGVLFWAIKSGQYDDLEKESQRILLDDDQPTANKKANTQVAANTETESASNKPSD